MTTRKIAAVYVVFLVQNKDTLNKTYENIVTLFKNKNIDINREFYTHILQLFDQYEDL